MKFSCVAGILVYACLSATNISAAENFALGFDGTRRGASVDNPMAAAGQEFTWEGWVQLSAKWSQALIVSHRAETRYRTFAAYSNTAETLEVSLDLHERSFPESPQRRIWVWVPFTQDAWTHVACSYDRADIRLYVNGKEALVRPTPEFNGILNWTADYRGTDIGTDLHDEFPPYCQGLIDEVRIWSVARTEAEIADWMHLRITEPQEGLLAVYSFDEGLVSQQIANSLGLLYDGYLGAEPVQDSLDALRVRSTSPLNYVEILGVAPHPISTAGALLRVDGRRLKDPSGTVISFDGNTISPESIEDDQLLLQVPPHLDGEALLEIRSSIGYAFKKVIYRSEFLRADANGDGKLDVSDGVRILSYLFLTATVDCEDAVDADDSGRLDVTDGVSLLTFLFQGGGRPPEPFLEIGPDPTTDTLFCHR